jgi:hypothetical protein
MNLLDYKILCFIGWFLTCLLLIMIFILYFFNKFLTEKNLSYYEWLNINSINKINCLLNSDKNIRIYKLPIPEGYYKINTESIELDNEYYDNLKKNNKKEQ